MSRIILAILLHVWVFGNSQAQEIYLFDLDKSLKTSNPVNISKNPDSYDNQPFFVDHNSLVFSSTRNNQTDIRKYSIETETLTWITNTGSSEFSPAQVPKTRDLFSAVRLDQDGAQFLCSYNIEQSTASVLIPKLKIGYYAWVKKNLLVSFVVNDQESSLVVSDLKSGRNRALQQNIGRSLHKIPGTRLISYVSKTNVDWEIRSLDPKTGETKYIIFTLNKSEDMCWAPDGTILMGSNNELFKYHPEKDADWKLLNTFEYNGITRIGVSPDGQKIAIVFEEEN